MLEYNFIIETEEEIDPRYQKAEKKENDDLAERPENYIDHIENRIETLDTPVPGYFIRTPSYTPMISSLHREMSK